MTAHPPKIDAMPHTFGPLYHYDRSGRRLTTGAEVEAALADIDSRTVAKDDVTAPDGKSYQVSTVFLVIDHRLDMAGPPVLYETAVFRGDDSEVVERYCTEGEAAAGHRDVMLLVEQGALLLKR